ncbi:TIGR03089 family protein [Gordonia desulfuricans]|uniref:TIGR03089 family protein n=1 Tax=Gordonia desulfuricans TaxID=89051 RepID=A0A7K3LTD8_9ACTN|nr:MULTISPECIES: TIGR03089 family protein [Gordonia]KOY49281.1 acetyl-CoA synthetase [Gordonia sp. NB41Y]NDK91499.1 TIGR03089 family protein [Gordonia desulfuricans]WLP91483.1 TIGR03089 family protein [Gordonia sp. NB41Y]
MTTSEKTLTAAVFDAVDDHTRPALTFYDDATDERTELSWATLGNWAAKTANFLVAELGSAPGDDVVVDLPEHWQTAGILLGAWWAGAHVHVPGDGGLPDSPIAVFTSAEGIDAHPDAEELLVAPLDPFALPVKGLPPGVSDFGSRVRVHGDQMRGPRYGGPALNGVAGETVLTQARSAAQTAGLEPGGRVLSTREWRSAAGIVADLLGPLATGTGLVWVAHPSGPQDRRAETERAVLLPD